MTRLKKFLNEAVSDKKVKRLKNFVQKWYPNQTDIKNISASNSPKDSIKIEVKRNTDIDSVFDWFSENVFDDIKKQKTSIILKRFGDNRVPNKPKSMKGAKKKKPETKRKYGKYLFGEFRDLGEEDTEREDEIFDLLMGFTQEDFGANLKPAFVDAVKELIKQKKFYPLLDPQVQRLYRFVPFNEDRFKEIAKENGITKKSDLEHNLTKVAGFNLFNIGTIMYKSRSEVQSWSDNLEGMLRKWKGSQATGFKNKDFIIFELNKPKSDEILFKSSFMNEIGYKEDEVIRIASKPAKVNVYIKISDPEDFLEKVDELLQ